MCVTDYGQMFLSIGCEKASKFRKRATQGNAVFSRCIHSFTPILAMVWDKVWLPSIYRRWWSMIRLWNRLILLMDERLTKKVFNADLELCIIRQRTGPLKSSKLWTRLTSVTNLNLNLSFTYQKWRTPKCLLCKKMTGSCAACPKAKNLQSVQNWI